MAVLERQAREKEEGVISGLKDATDRLKYELDQARTQLKATKTKLVKVEVHKMTISGHIKFHILHDLKKIT